jgi:hypothetical protein
MVCARYRNEVQFVATRRDATVSSRRNRIKMEDQSHHRSVGVDFCIRKVYIKYYWIVRYFGGVLTKFASRAT